MALEQHCGSQNRRDRGERRGEAPETAGKARSRVAVSARCGISCYQVLFVGRNGREQPCGSRRNGAMTRRERWGRKGRQKRAHEKLVCTSAFLRVKFMLWGRTARVQHCRSQERHDRGEEGGAVETPAKARS